MSWNSKFPEAMKVTIDGKLFPSVRAAANHYKCDPKTIRRLIDKFGGEIPEFTMEAPRKPKEVIYFGKKYPSISEAARKNRTTYRTVEKYRDKTNPV